MTYYVKENNKINLFNKMFIKIDREDNELKLPISINQLCTKNKKIHEFYITKLISNLVKIIKNNQIVLSKNLKENKDFLENLNKNHIIFYDGKWLYRYILNELLEYILKKKNEAKENTEISFLVNYVDDIIVQNIKKFAKEYKRINIITNHIERFKKIEKDLYDEDGIMITVTNNKRKSLIKSKYIINFDFPEELINKYRIYEKALIISIENEIKINKKRFCGTIVSDYNIILEKEFNIKNDYDIKDLFESLIFRKDNFYNIRKNVENSGLHIIQIYGKNGCIERL